MSARLSGLFVYPLKGARGTSVDRWHADRFGLRYDRRWMVVDAHGVAVTQRDDPRLALIEPRLEAETLMVTAPGAGCFALPLENNGQERRRVQVWDDVVAATDAGDEAARWISAYLAAPSRIVFMPDDVVRPVSLHYGRAGDSVGFADAYPFLLISQGSLDELNRRLERPVPMNRFRPNLVVDGVSPHAEDDWARVTIGGMAFDVVKPCARCTVPTVDQATGQRGKEPLRTLAKYRRVNGAVMFGQNLIHRGLGELRIGDPLEVIAIR